MVSLCPILDQKGLLRVAGRLQNSLLGFSEKHPLIIPSESHLAKLIIRDAHARTQHGGNQATLAIIRRKYWIIRGKALIKTVLRQCVLCCRLKATMGQQIMGNLPKERVTISPPFSHSGLDYAGPIQVRVSKGRGNKSYKGYIAIFICMATKAIHLEVVSDMTTDAFLAAFRRFSSRRGHCSKIYSDNGTTFVGAEKVMRKELSAALQEQDFQQMVACEGTEWHFIPPGAPHFGGLWEAGVKSTKYHMKRVIGDHTLTYEELSTVLCQIEACLNSRPLYVINENPEEIFVLTPAHFLNGRPLSMLPDETDINDEVKITSRWRLLQKMENEFWKIWSTEYLHTLQQRTKWKTPENNVAIGDVVLLKDENVTPTRWPLARVTEIHPGKDEKVRVITVKTSNGNMYKRPVTKVCTIPVVSRNDVHTQPAKATTRRPTSTTVNTTLSILTYLMLAVISVVTTSNASSFTLKPVNPGLYVEHMGDALINRGILRIDMMINGSTLEIQRQHINKTILQFKELCQTGKALSDRIQCDGLLHDLSERFQGLQGHLREIANESGSRTKRGVLGQLLTSVFGVNDEVYKDINELDQNQKHLIQASREQTSLMVKTVTTLNATEQRISRKMNQFIGKLNQGLAEIHELERWYRATDENKIYIHILYVHQLAHGFIAELEEHYNKILRVIHHHGHLLDFLTIQEFQSLITNATARLPVQMQIAYKNMINMEVKYNTTHIMLHAFFYITEIPKFTLINVSPVPQRVKNNIFAALTLSSVILAINYNDQHYFDLSEEELQQGIQLEPARYLLAPHIIYDMNTSPSCVIDEIYSRGSTQNCSHHTFKIQDVIWKKLMMPNTWLFVSSNTIRVGVECNGQREDVWINETGILQIRQGFTINHNENLLKAKTTMAITGVTAFHKPIQIDIKTIVPVIHKVQDRKVPLFKPHEDFSEILHDENLLKENVTRTTWEIIHPHMTSSALGSLTTLAILVVVSAGLFVVIRRCQQQPSSSRSRSAVPSFMLVPQDVQERTDV